MKIYTLSWFSANSSSVLGVYSTFDLAKQTMSTLLEIGETIDSENAQSCGGTTRYPILCHGNDTKDYFEIRLFYLDDDEEENDEDWDDDEDEDDWEDEEEDEDDDDWDEDWDEDDDDEDEDWNDDDDDDALAALQTLLKRDDVEVEVELEIVVEGE